VPFDAGWIPCDIGTNHSDEFLRFLGQMTFLENLNVELPPSLLSALPKEVEDF